MKGGVSHACVITIHVAEASVAGQTVRAIIAAIRRQRVPLPGSNPRRRTFLPRRIPLGAKELAQQAVSGDFDVKRQTAWGMSDTACQGTRCKGDG